MGIEEPEPWFGERRRAAAARAALGPVRAPGRTGPGPSARYAGFSLVETLLALFVALLGSILCAQLFQLAARAQVAARARSQAVMLAETIFQQVEVESRDPAWWEVPAPPAGCTLDGTAPYPAEAAVVPWRDDEIEPPEHPEARIRVAAWKNVVHSPARGMAGSYRMLESECLVKVTVRWGGSSSGAARPGETSLSLVGVLRAPDRRAEGIRVTVAGGSQPLAPYAAPSTGVVDLTAQAYDGHGDIPDLRYLFYAAPKTGNATLIDVPPNPDGTARPDTARLANYVLLPLYPGPRCIATGGRCGVDVRCVEDGRETWNRSTVLSLQQAGLSQNIRPARTPWPFSTPGGTP